KIGAPQSLAFTVFVAAPQAVGPSAPFATMTLNDLDSTLLEEDDYRGAVEAVVASHDSKGFVLEGMTYRINVLGYAPGLAEFIDSGAIVTRATTVVGRQHLSDDVLFAKPYPGEIPNRRTTSLSPLRTRTAGIGSLGLLLAAHALRRRSRRR
ncbi:MAG: hypothetical protein ABW133_26105, partial [Polyangiaceae bacterium]